MEPLWCDLGFVTTSHGNKAAAKTHLSVPKLSQNFHRLLLSVPLNTEVPPKKNLSHFAKILGYPLISSDGMDSDQLVYVLLSVFGEKIAFFSLNSKNVVSSIQSLGKLEGLRQLGYLICVQLIMLKD